MNRFDLETVNHFVLHKQHLTGESKINNVLQITHDIGGLHATGATIPYLSLFIRSESFTKEDLERELYIKKTLARIRYVRKTLYILPKEKIPIAFAAVAKNSEVMTKQHMEYLQLTPKKYKDLTKKILLTLENQALTTKEIKRSLGEIPNLSYILRMMCFQGLLIRGKPQAGWKSSLHTYHPFHLYYPDMDLGSISEEDAQEVVIKDYISSFGPVTEKDIIWWTGFNKGSVKKALTRLNGELEEIEIKGLDGKFIHFSSQWKDLKSLFSSQKLEICLLPYLDPYLMGYKERERCLDKDFFDYIYDRSGNATSSILFNGKIIGVWDFGQLHFKYFLFEKVSRSTVQSIQVQGLNVRRFISDDVVQIKECTQMVPLPQRTAGGFMTPLKDC